MAEEDEVMSGSPPAVNLTDNLTGTQKAAILLIALGPEKSSLIFKYLKEEEIEELKAKDNITIMSVEGK